MHSKFIGWKELAGKLARSWTSKRECGEEVCGSKRLLNLQDTLIFYSLLSGERKVWLAKWIFTVEASVLLCL